MVNKVVPRDQLDAEARAMALQIAEMPSFGLRQAKRAVNQTLDVQGFYAAVQSVFDIHQTGHGNALSVSGYPILVKLDEMKEKDQVGPSALCAFLVVRATGKAHRVITTLRAPASPTSTDVRTTNPRGRGCRRGSPSR